MAVLLRPVSPPVFELRLHGSEPRVGLTREALGYRSGLARNYVGMVERGEANISFTAMERWLAATGMSWERIGKELHDALGSTSVR